MYLWLKMGLFLPPNTIAAVCFQSIPPLMLTVISLLPLIRKAEFCYWVSFHPFDWRPAVCLLQPGPGIVCCALWTSASTTWRSPTLSCPMTPCMSVRPQRLPCALGEPNSTCSVSQNSTDTFGKNSFWLQCMQFEQRAFSFHANKI